MNRWPALAGFALLAYLVGSVNLSLIVTSFLGLRDPRKGGSGNAGATNLWRSAGARVAIPVLLLDFSKAYFAVFVAGLYLPENLAPLLMFPLLIGNIFPVFHGFKGGRGVAVVVGGFLAISPLTVLLAGGVFIVVILLFQRVSLGSMLMIASYVIWTFLLDAPLCVILTAAGVALTIIATHRANIARLLLGREPSLK